MSIFVGLLKRYACTKKKIWSKNSAVECFILKATHIWQYGIRLKLDRCSYFSLVYTLNILKLVAGINFEIPQLLLLINHHKTNLKPKLSMHHSQLHPEQNRHCLHEISAALACFEGSHDGLYSQFLIKDWEETKAALQSSCVRWHGTQAGTKRTCSCFFSRSLFLSVFLLCVWNVKWIRQWQWVGMPEAKHTHVNGVGGQIKPAHTDSLITFHLLISHISHLHTLPNTATYCAVLTIADSYMRKSRALHLTWPLCPFDV